MWRAEFELSRRGKLRRSLYKTLRNELDYALIEYGVIDSYNRVKKAGQEYKFPEKRELKPRGKVTEVENELIEGFIVLFEEYEVPAELKKYIRYFNNTKVTKDNLPYFTLSSSKVAPDLLKTQRNFEHAKFYDLLKTLLPVDYAVLIQQDNISRSKMRYALTHFHVRIDWLIDFAAESLGKRLRYISKDLYEKGEDYAENMVEKLFEYYSFHHTASGRRTAAVVASELLSSTDFISTVYVNSSESRTLTRIGEKGVTKYSVVNIPPEHLAELEAGEKYGIPDFRQNYILDDEPNGSSALFMVVYGHNEHSKPPADGKLRELQPDVNWLRIVGQYIIPKPSAKDAWPIPYQIIYDQQDPFSHS